MRTYKKSAVIIGILAVVAVSCAGDETAGDVQDTDPVDAGATEDDRSSPGETGEAEGGEGQIDLANVGEHQLTLASGVGATHPLFRGAGEGFAEHVDELSDSKIQVELFPEGQLGPLTESLAMLRDGVADLAHVISVYHPEELPLFQAWQLPWGVDEGTALNALWHNMHDTDGLILEELRNAGCVPLGAANSTPYEIMSAEKRVESVDDLSGMIVRSSGATSDQILEAFGASPAATTSSEQYEALQRGTVDATVIYPASALPWSLHEVTTSMTDGAELFILTGFNLCLSPGVWDGLNEDEKQVLYEAGRRSSVDAQRAIVDDDEVALSTFVEEGVELVEWSEEDRQPVRDLSEDIINRWVEEVEANNAPGSEVVAEIRNAIETAQAVEDPYELEDLGQLP